MADIGSLPTPGQKPWNLNPAINAINAELEGRLSDENLNATVGAVAGAAVVDTIDDDSAALAAQPSTATPAATVTDPAGLRHPGWMSRDRSVIFNLSGAPNVRYSLDDGATWNANPNALHAGTQAVRDLPDGEILVSAGTNPGKLYRSNGWAVNKQTATFTEVLTASSPNVYFHNGYGLWVGENGLVLAAEYGSKVAGANARYVYLSRDHGATWATIFDIGGAVETHIHGVAYDKWWRRIWVSTGDVQRGLHYSDDLGAEWNTVTRYDTTEQCKVTTIFPMAGAVLLLSDSAPNGVLRIRRRQRNNPLVEVAYRLNNSASITHIGQLAYQADVAGAPVLLSFTNDPAAGHTGPGRLVATTDGFRFWELWKDTIDYGAFGGLQACVGPTRNGKYIGTLVDGRFTNLSRLTLDAPSWKVPELPRAASALGDETMPRIAAVSEPVCVSGTVVFSYFRATETKDVSMIRAYTAATAAANTATLFRLGLYEVDGNGNLTLIAGGPSDTTKIQTAYNSVAQAISGRTVAGRWYAVGLLCIGPGQMPTLAGVNAAAGTKLPLGALFLDPKLSAQVAGQADLPATVAAATLAPSARIFWHAVA